MNIFFTDTCPWQAAINLGDRHVVSQVKESAQMLSTAQRMSGNTDEVLCKVAYPNHPCTVWVRSSSGHYAWLYEHFLALLAEFEHRRYKDHEYVKLIDPLSTPIAIVNSPSWRQPPQCMPQDCHVLGDSVLAYRSYYKKHKQRMHHWTNRQPPEWI